MMSNPDYCNHIKTELHKLHMTQREFAMRMNISKGYASMLVNGKCSLSLEVVRRLQYVLPVTYKYIIQNYIPHFHKENANETTK